MRDVRSLPPFLRVAGVFGLLFPLASLGTLVAMVVAFIIGHIIYHQDLANDPRLLAIPVNLNLLGLACTFVVNRYTTTLRHPHEGRFPLDSWQRQARAIALHAALPVCALTLAAIISPTQDVAVLALYLISGCGALVLVRAFAWSAPRA